MADLDQDIEAFESKKDELERHHLGKWILIHDQEVISAFDTFDTAAREAVRLFGRGPYLIRQVGSPPLTLPASYMAVSLHGHC